jgi:pyrophosphatase PpaX
MACYRAAVAECLSQDITDAEILEAILTRSNLEAQMACLGRTPETAGALVRAYRQHYYGPGGPPPRLYPGVDDCLAGLSRAGLSLGLVTSRMRLREQDGLRWGVSLALADLGLAHLFRVTVGYEDTEEHKPAPDPFAKGVELLGLPADRVLAVGDSPMDVLSARAAGLPVAGALWGAMDRPALLAAKPDWVLETLEDLRALIGS